VFRGGRKIATLSSAQAREDQVSIPQLMLQAEMGALYPAKAGEVTTRIGLEVDGLTVTGAFENVSFAARPGEILGFFGLVGSGIDALAKALFGIAKVADGQIWVAGKPVSLSNPRAALQSGIFLVPGDRRVEGLVLTDDVSFNSTLANLMRASRMGGFLKFSENRRNISELAERVELRPPALTRAASEFSGGNQQKIVIAKGLYRQADIYIFVEPTTGVDIGARLKLYGLIRELSQKSVVIVMSSDCDEIFGLCDRMGAMYKGRLALQPTRLLSRDQLLAAGIMSQPPQSQTNDEPGGSVQTIRL
jgi:ribose transport system ATP-binding protein